MRPRGTITSRSPGSYRIRYSLGRDPVSGKRKFGTATVRGTRREAERELVRLLRTVDTGEHVDPTRLTVGEWLEAWLRALEISPKAKERYGEVVRCYLIPALGQLQLSKLVPVQIQEAYSGLRRKDGGALSPHTRRYIHVILKSALGRAVEQQLLARNPAEMQRMPRVERKERVTLTVDQSVRLLKSISHMHIYWPVLLALTTGMRRGEILALRWRNVDLAKGNLAGCAESRANKRCNQVQGLQDGKEQSNNAARVCG